MYVFVSESSRGEERHHTAFLEIAFLSCFFIKHTAYVRVRGCLGLTEKGMPWKNSSKQSQEFCSGCRREGNLQWWLPPPPILYLAKGIFSRTVFDFPRSFHTHPFFCKVNTHHSLSILSCRTPQTSSCSVLSFLFRYGSCPRRWVPVGQKRHCIHRNQKRTRQYLLSEPCVWDEARLDNEGILFQVWHSGTDKAEAVSSMEILACKRTPSRSH